MAVSVRARASGQGTSNSAALTFTETVPLPAGHVLVAFVTAASSNTIFGTTPAGWTRSTPRNSGSSVAIAWYWRNADASVNGITVPLGSSVNWDVTLMAFPGWVSDTVDAAETWNTYSSGTSLSLGPGTATSAANTIYLFGARLASSSGGYSDTIADEGWELISGTPTYTQVGVRSYTSSGQTPSADQAWTTPRLAVASMLALQGVAFSEATPVRQWTGDSVFGLDSTFQECNPAILWTTDRTLSFGGTGTRLLRYSPLGLTGYHEVTFYLKKTGNPSSSNPIIAPLTSGGASAYRIRLSSTGTLIVDNSSNAAVGSATTALSDNVWYRVEYTANTTVFELKVFTVSTGVQLGATVGGSSTFGAVDNWRMGQVSSSPNIPTFEVDKIAIWDEAGQNRVIADGATATGLSVAVIGDSRTNMAPDASTIFGEGQELVGAAFVAAGIDLNNVYFWGVGGKRMTVADLTGKTFANNYADAVAMLGGHPDVVVAHLGKNDEAQNDATINGYLSTLNGIIDSSVFVRWIGETSRATASADDTRVNGLVSSALATRGNAEHVDWDSVIRALDGGSNPSSYWQDSTHPTHTGYLVLADLYVPGDNTPPTVAITSHTEDQVIASGIVLEGTVSDNDAVDRVEISIDGAYLALGTVDSGDWSYNLSTSVYPNGSHTLRATAYDVSDNSAYDEVDLDFQNSPPFIPNIPGLMGGRWQGDRLRKVYLGSTLLFSDSGEDPTPPGGSQPTEVASYGPNGTHWFTDTPWFNNTWDNEHEVACTGTAIQTQINTCSTSHPTQECIILVQPGTIIGNGAGATSTPVIQNVGVLDRAGGRVLVAPRDGYGTVIMRSVSISNVASVSFAGIVCPNDYGILLRNCRQTGLGWSYVAVMQLLSIGNSGLHDVELVEVVVSNVATLRAPDRSSLRTEAGYNGSGLVVRGCYFAPAYKPTGSSAHCDTFQVSCSASTFTDVLFEDTAVFSSTNVSLIGSGGLTGWDLDHTAVIGGLYGAQYRYPMLAGGDNFTSGTPLALNGGNLNGSAVNDTLVLGGMATAWEFDLVSSSSTTDSTPNSAVSGSWTVDSTLGTMTTTEFDALIPIADDARLASLWVW